MVWVPLQGLNTNLTELCSSQALDGFGTDLGDFGCLDGLVGLDGLGGLGGHQLDGLEWIWEWDGVLFTFGQGAHFQEVFLFSSFRPKPNSQTLFKK